ncbi:hypothetical protein BZA05DRAFT_370271 [Tricharina praecox]|uniref:uncharacterized protein n=1 Tax=Tricharina praecox TaxID=43433 RepID=UPI0022203C7F|nr:uncharacterized protein BZA05DRAFT_370271 [Tricharina praecox]KAI5855385.1 hypothetical protein BZA05DRAFT_370271 [Tricharina praecox]
MYPSPSKTFLAAVAVALTLSSAVEAVPASASSSGKPVYPGAKGLKYFFSFGDSYTQTGFNLTDGSPMPSSGNPLGNPVYPGWTSANGPNWIDYLTVEFNKTETLTYNMAYGGATIDAALVAPYRPEVFSLKDQVQTFFPLASGHAANWKASNSLFLVWIGINDIGGSYWAHPDDVDGFQSGLMDVYFGLVDELYSAGARNFLFLDVPPIQRAPLTVESSAEAVALETRAVNSYNALLSSRVSALKKAHTDVWSKIVSTTKVFNNIMDRPAKYGFENATGWCEEYSNGTPEWDTQYSECGPAVDKYVWLNNLHPTHLVHKEVAKAAAKVL